MNQQGRPTQPGEATPIRRATFTGNRALDMEESLIFESGRLDEVFRSLTLGGVDAGGIPAMAEPAAAA